MHLLRQALLFIQAWNCLNNVLVLFILLATVVSSQHVATLLTQGFRLSVLMCEQNIHLGIYITTSLYYVILGYYVLMKEVTFHKCILWVYTLYHKLSSLSFTTVICQIKDLLMVLQKGWLLAFGSNMAPLMKRHIFSMVFCHVFLAF